MMNPVNSTGWSSGITSHYNGYDKRDVAANDCNQTGIGSPDRLQG